jgi:hypothetical protein
MSLCKAGSLQTEASKLVKFELDLVAMQEVRRVQSANQIAEVCTFLCGNGNLYRHLEAGFLLHKEIT